MLVDLGGKQVAYLLVHEYLLLHKPICGRVRVNQIRNDTTIDDPRTAHKLSLFRWKGQEESERERECEPAKCFIKYVLLRVRPWTY